MLPLLISVILFTSLEFSAACEYYHDPECIVNQPLEQSHFLNKWIVHIPGGEEVAREVAKDIGLDFKEPMENHEDHYFFTHPEVPMRHKMKNSEIMKKLKNHEKISSSDQQYAFQLSLNELDDFKDMVGYNEPLSVRITTFDPDDENALLKSEEKPFHIHFEEPSDQEKEFRRKYADGKLPPLNEIIDFPGLYAEKKKANRQYWQKIKQMQEVR